MIRIRRILVPTDFGDSSTPAVRYGARMAEAFGAELILLNVVPDAALILPDAVMPAPVPTTELSKFLADAKENLSRLVAAEKLESLHPKVEVRVGSPVPEILAAAADLKADLLCVGTHGRHGLSHLLLGSLAERIIRDAPCPVLTVGPLAVEMIQGSAASTMMP
jgi:nucleotide-binding universal stress UspA family protein